MLFPKLPLPLRASRLFSTASKRAGAWVPGFAKNHLDEEIHEKIGNMRALILTNSFNSMAQRAFTELVDKYSMDVRVEFAINEKQIMRTVERHTPDLIICPYLTKRIPEDIWMNRETPCLIVHPGIHGDRGASSIDWALKDNHAEWGVTVLSADQEMDAGDIWSTKNFHVPSEISKSELYGSFVVDHAMQCLHEAIKNVATGAQGTPLDYTDLDVNGTLRPNMKLLDRMVDFNYTAEQVARQIRMSDSAPGAPCELEGQKLFLYNAHVHIEDTSMNQEIPGTVIGVLDGAVRIACAQGSIWVTHMKGRGKDSKLLRIKLPATQILPSEALAGVPKYGKPCIFDAASHPFPQVSVTVQDEVAFVNFPFLNGAMSTEQCESLTEAFRRTCARPDVKIVVLTGGNSAWSNGINLNTIEAASNPAEESWRNINAMNDLVKAIFSETTKVTVAALQGNAGAGGLMAALACDFVWAHNHAILNPHYKLMGLHGSEYWTYFLPRRVGNEMASKLTESCMPVSATSAQAIGMINDVIAPNRSEFAEQVKSKSGLLAKNDALINSILSHKAKERDQEWHKVLEEARSHELRVMKENFVNQEYVQAREAFVFKKAPKATPAHLIQSHTSDSKCSQARPEAVAMCGQTVSQLIQKDLIHKISKLQAEGVVSPKLAVLIVDGNANSERYVRQKGRTAEKVGIRSETHRFDPRVETQGLEEALVERIQSLNKDSDVNGIMVQLPLPPGVNKYRVLAAICPQKDVDGFMALGLGRLAGGVCTDDHYYDQKHLNSKEGPVIKKTPHFIPCTAKGVLALIDHYSIPLLGKRVCIIGRSSIVGIPTTLCLMKRGATVTNCDIHSGEASLQASIGNADVVIAAAGSPGLVKAVWIKPGAVVIDAGFHVVSSGLQDAKDRIVGDVEPAAKGAASLMTPVPGGVGPMTVTMLLQNTMEAFLAQR